MAIRINKHAFSRACSVLFGPDLPRLESLQTPEWQRDLKAAFRRRLLETHPDLAAALGRPAEELTLQFLEATRAYEWLAPLAVADDELVFHEPAAPSAGTPVERATTARPVFYRAPPPQRKLRFAEFLYYSGLISWQAMVDAVGWQRRQRPRLGAIAVSWGYLSRDALDDLLLLRREMRAMHVPIGEFALLQRVITPYQLLALVRRQRALQPAIGVRLVEKGAIAASDMPLLLSKQREHNARCR